MTWQKKMKERQQISRQLLSRCREDCLAGHEACDKAAERCFSIRSQEGLVDFQQVAKECARFCMATADLVDRGLPVSKHVCEACADICDRCVALGEALVLRDVTIITCVRMCEQCARTCRTVAAALDGGEATTKSTAI